MEPYAKVFLDRPAGACIVPLAIRMFPVFTVYAAGAASSD
jgi:hypothetical protein